MKTVCIYHKNCFDGIAAAWVINKVYPDAEFVAAQYGDQQLINNLIHDCYENANINDRYIIVDFSFTREIMEQLANKVKEVLVLDHHKTAQKECEGLSFCIFDMNMSGAELAWYHYQELGMLGKMPELIKYIADRDLWKFELPNSNAINAYIQSMPMDFTNYESLFELLESETGLEKAVIGGRSIERYKKSMTEGMCNNMKLRIVGGYNIPTINATLLFSEIGHELCKKWPEYPFAASYFIRNDNRVQWSLRSIGDFDVSEVAKKNGGGGHKNAAGFEISLESFTLQENTNERHN